MPHLVDARGVFHRVFGGGDTGWLGNSLGSFSGGGKPSAEWPSECVDSCGKDWLRESTRSLKAIPKLSLKGCAAASELSVSRDVVRSGFGSATGFAAQQQSYVAALLDQNLLLQVLSYLLQALE